MVAKPSEYLNKSVSFHRQSSSPNGVNKDVCEEVKLTDLNIREAIYRTTGLCINSSQWTGIPGYCRFTVALEETDFDRALGCITKFKTLVLG